MTNLSLFESVFAHHLSDEILGLARERLLTGGNLAPRGCDKRKAKLALLVVIAINPKETLKRSEAALLYGISENSLRNGKRIIRDPTHG